MRRMRTGLLLALAVATLAATPLSAQVAPSLNGETGLFGIFDAQTVPHGRFAFSIFYSMYDRTAASVPQTVPFAQDPMRYSTDKLGLSIGFGLLPNWEASFSAGQRYYSAGDRLWGGNLGGRDRIGKVDHDESDKLRIGTKLVVNPKDPVKVALFGAAYIPTQSRNDPYALSSYRTDWEWGFSGTYGIFTGQFSYLWTGDWGVEFEEYEISNEMRWSAGVGVPLIPDRLKGIFELHRTMYDGGTTEPPDFTDAVVGARFALGEKGLVAGAGLRVNVDRWVKYGSSPSNVGALVQLSWMPQPAQVVEAPAVVPSPHEPPPAEPVPAPGVAPAPAPVGAGPRPRRRSSPGAEAGDLDDRRDPLRLGEEPADEHRQGDPRRRRAPPEEQPLRDLHDRRPRRPGREGRPGRPRRGAGRRREGLPREAARHRRGPDPGRRQGRRRGRGRRDAEPPRGRHGHLPLAAPLTPTLPSGRPSPAARVSGRAR